ncbi:adenine-specific DNA-methyltransferase [Bradyrhizobium sp. i1.8.4]|uniref:site-specific DNA-methyltransferase n=1 Tax=unclassified Bradyrhizobium TaxID=2631580 RepID=UPI003D195925
MARKGKANPASTAKAGEAITSIKYSAKRKNIPPAGLEAQGVLGKAPRIRYEYNPHLPTVLRSAVDGTATDKLPQLIALARQRALSADEAKVLVDALRRHEPWLEWSGKREKLWFEVDPVALHMHERISTQAILRVLAREDVDRDLFADPQHEYAKAVQFYQHDMDWANRMILGDSLQVMASLARREDLANKLQMIYIDPPYGIRFTSNFQPQLGQRDVKDREQDLTREPEMVKAYRDTWTLGIHSYLAYLRDRLAMAKELLADTGSIFVQISDENLHRVRCLMDEVLGSNNFVSMIGVRKTGGATSVTLPTVTDTVLWYAKDIERMKYRPLYVEKELGEEGAAEYFNVELPNGAVRLASEDEISGRANLPEGARIFATDSAVSDGFRTNTSVPFDWSGIHFDPGKTKNWKTTIEGMLRLCNAGRIVAREGFRIYKRYFDDFPVRSLNNVWMDVRGALDRIYVVQTATKVIERCLLMVTDPGDLVLDPTCGSGTTAFVAEQWGRRWITCDSSRVALVLAKHRLMTAKFDYQQLRPLNAEDVARNPNGTWLTDPTGKVSGKATFLCKAVPHITLKSIARNSSLDPIFAKYQPVLDQLLVRLNREVAKTGAGLKEKLGEKLIQKHREEGANSITDADKRRWLLPDMQKALVKSIPARKPLKGITPRQADAYRGLIPKAGWREWEVPFDSDPEWPRPLQEALSSYRAAWRAKMDDVNACINANAKMEELVDKPEPVKGVVRVTGPFTLEGVIAVEDGLDTPIGGAPDELEPFDGEAATTNAEAHLDKIIRLLKASGVDFPGNKNMKFSRLDPMAGASLLHAEGEWVNGDKKDRRVAISIGPEVGNVSAMQVEDAIRAANRKGYDDVVFAGFGFDAAAQEAIESASHPKVRLHMALIRPDIAMGNLLKTQPGSQLFTVFSAPRVKGPTPQADNEFVVEVDGMDVYDPVSNTLFPTDQERIAAWFLDTDYDGRTFCICQAFFPDKTKWSRLAKALGDADVIDEDAFDALSGLKSLPFPRPPRIGKGESWRVAVKVIDPRGNEGLRVLTIP